MKQRLPWFLGLLAAIVMLASCKKEDKFNSTAENYFFKAKFNGVEKKFSTKSFASKFTVDGKYVLSIVASLGNETSSITLWSGNDAFKQDATFSAGAVNGYTNSFDYTSNQLSGDPSNSWASTSVHNSFPENFQCTLTSVTSTCVRGNFSADVYSYKNNVLQKMSITGGEFYVRLQ